jgi:hypothetical protein
LRTAPVLLSIADADISLTAVWPEHCLYPVTIWIRNAIMGSGDFRREAAQARPILNERDYQNAKALLAKEMHQKHTEQAWARLEALMQEVAEYERRFLEGEEDDASRWVEYAYASVLERTDAPQRRWSDISGD